MNKTVYDQWFKTVFVPSVRSRTCSPVIVVIDNFGAHTNTICPPLPNVTSAHQPLDAGIIACLKWRYKKRLILFRLGTLRKRRCRQEAAAAAATAASTVAAMDTGAAAEAAPREPSGTNSSAASSAVRRSLATGVGSNGTSLDASLAARPFGISQLMVPRWERPLAGRPSASNTPASATEAVAPPFTVCSPVKNSALASSLLQAPLLPTSGTVPPPYSPPTVNGLPDPTS